MSEEHRDGKFWFGFFLGGLIGALIIFFLGTKEGKKAGKLIEKKGQDLLEGLQDKVEELEEKGRELAARGEDLKEQVIEEFIEKKEELTEAAAEKLDSALAHIEALQEHGRQTTASLRKKLFKNLPKKA
ncbi:MAG: hypothetical protein ACOY0S_01995 [Patescibacteria group bacterium]